MQQEVIREWLERRTDSWRELQELIKLHRRAGNADLDKTREFVQQYQSVQSDLILARSELPKSELTRKLTLLLVSATRELSRPATNFRAELSFIYASFIPGLLYRWRFKLLGLSLLFILSGLAMAALITAFPDLGDLFLSSAMITKVQSGELWTEEIFNIMPSSVMAFQIMTNNIAVTLFAYALGIFYGLGTLYITIMNGMMLGAVFAYTHQYHLSGKLLDFVVAHGFVELSVIVIAATAGFALGESIARPGPLSRTESFRYTAKEGMILILGCAPFLILAGIIEGYISPSTLPFAVKLLIGLVYWALFIWILTGNAFRKLAISQPT